MSCDLKDTIEEYKYAIEDIKKEIKRIQEDINNLDFSGLENTIENMRDDYQYNYANLNDKIASLEDDVYTLQLKVEHL